MTVECQHCGTAGDTDAAHASIFMCGLCPACRPDQCPDCGCVDILYDVRIRQWRCDNGCGPFEQTEVVG